MKEENLIFIISQPRSGSTYLQNLLSNNNDVSTTSEHWLLLNFANQFNSKLIKSAFENNLSTDAFNDFLQKHPNYNFKEHFKSFLLQIYNNTVLKPNHKFVIDKTPRYWEISEEIISFFPKSKVIILKRNPLNVLQSIIKTWDVKSLKHLNEYRRDLLLAPYKINEFSQKHKEEKNVYILKYEDLIVNLKQETKKIYDWIGLSFSETVLETKGNYKIQGKYGDPFQNTNEYSKNKDKKLILTPDLNGIVEGYAAFLGEKFMNDYGEYKILKAQEFNNTNIFDKYLNLTPNFSAKNEQPIKFKVRNRLRVFINRLKNSITIK